jgi:amino acid adenylation domain-containing protein
LPGPEALKTAIERLVARHEALRSEYTLRNGRLQQTVVTAPAVTLERCRVPVADLDGYISQLFSEDSRAAASFDGPPLRIRVVPVANSDVVALFTVHHIAVDGASIGVMAKDLGALLRGTELPPTSGPLRFSALQQSLTKSDQWAQSKAHWMTMLMPLPEALELPLDRPRPARPAGNGGENEQRLTGSTESSIRSLAQKAKTTPFCVVLAAVAALAHRFSGQNDVLLATPTSLRLVDPSLDDAVGCFVNLLPLRISLEGLKTLEDVVAKTEDALRQALAHGGYPFETMLRDFPGGRTDAARFTRLVVAQDVDPQLPLRADEFEINECRVATRLAPYELTVFVRDGPDALVLRWVFDTALYDSVTIERFKLALSLLVGEVACAVPFREIDLCERPDHNSDIPLAPPHAVASTQDIVSLFDAVAQQAPDAVALSTDCSTVTYGTLARWSHAIAAGLEAVGVREGTPVLVGAKRSPYFIAAILGVLRAGGYYVPVDDRTPPQRLSEMCQAIGVVHALQEVSDAREFPAGVVSLLIEPMIRAPLVPERQMHARTPESLAYVMFTSGSTGQPKGVAIPDRGVVRLVQKQSFAQFAASDRFILASNLCFDAATFEIWGALLNGGRLVIPTEDAARNPSEVAALIARADVTAGFFNVPYFRAMVEDDVGALRGMKTILVGGENVPESLFVKAAQTLDYRCLLNGYGPTENTTFSCVHRLQTPPVLGRAIPIGHAIEGSLASVVDEALHETPIGVAGEIVVGGAGLARGYVGNDAETEKKFVLLANGVRVYRTGDLGRRLPSGDLQYLGRMDGQVKIRGFRIELGEIEGALLAHPQVKAAVVLAVGVNHSRRLEAYVEGTCEAENLRRALAESLPDYMVPAHIVVADRLPLNANGKVDRLSLPALGRAAFQQRAIEPPTSETQRRLAEIFRGSLHLDAVGVHDRFFDIGMDSLAIAKMAQHLSEAFARPVRPVDLLDNPTIVSLAGLLDSADGSTPIDQNEPRATSSDVKIAIVGMAGRFPGSEDVATYWARSLAGVVDVTETAGLALGVVGSRGVVKGTDLFDAGFFGITEREARLMDPQQRMLLEVAQLALDDAAIDPVREQGPISVHAACGPVEAFPTSGSLAEQYEQELALAPDFAATRLSYRLNLRGESMTVQTGCSSSLSAVHLACQGLIAGTARFALAVAASFKADQTSGYMIEEGMITSPTGRCRPFDHEADGAVPGGGVAAVVLSRLGDALRAGLPVRAVIIGTASNNDGASKVGFMAPSPTGQAEVIAGALAVAGTTSSSIGYVETHGTGTALGDSVEVEGLRRAFAQTPAQHQWCALGSVKANCGHMDRASGLAGLIRAALAVEGGEIPPMANFTKANPSLGLEASPFYIPTSARRWPSSFPVRRAGVSSFGVGGTNIHALIEEPPRREALETIADAPTLLPLSAHEPQLLQHQANALSLALQKNSGKAVLARSGMTLALGRREQRYRGFVVARSTNEAASALKRMTTAREAKGPHRLVLAFPGQGEAGVDGMKGLYDRLPVYRKSLDRCADIVSSCAHFDFRERVFDRDGNTDFFADMGKFQPTMFSVQWSLAELLADWGISPDILIGHSLGEIVAATRAGVFDPVDALRFVALRGRAMQESEPGAMLAITMGSDWVASRLPRDCSIAAFNGENLVAVSGLPIAIAELEALCSGEGVMTRRLAIPRAAHTQTMEVAGQRIFDLLAQMRLQPPTTNLFANLTGDLATQSIADPTYWKAQIAQPVRFASSLEHLRSGAPPLVLTVGPGGDSLRRLIAHELGDAVTEVVSTQSSDVDDEHISLLAAIGTLWAHGTRVDLARVCGEHGPRLSLPGTAFNHRVRWPVVQRAADIPTATTARAKDPGAWLWRSVEQPLIAAAQRMPPLRVGCVGTSATELAQLQKSVATGMGEVRTLERGVAEADVTDIIWRPVNALSALMEADSVAATALKSGARVWACVPRDDADIAAAALAAVVVVPFEHGGADWRFVTVDAPFDPKTAALMCNLMQQTAPPRRVSITDSVAATEFEHAWPDVRSRGLRHDGCYLVTGGVGRVGRALALAIAREVPANIVVVGRRPLTKVGKELDSLQLALAKLHSTVAYQQVDVSDPMAMLRCVEGLRASHGRINGVIHSAGFTDRQQFSLLSKTDAHEMERIGQAKKEGAKALLQALAPDEADFVLLCSSLSTALGGVGFGAYVAANAWLDDFSRARWAAGDRRWISVAWDAWEGERTPASADLLRYALNDDDGYQVFRRVLSTADPVIIISTGQIDKRAAEALAQVTDTASREALFKEPEDLQAGVEQILSEVLGELADDPNRDLRLQGVESLTILQIVNRLRRRFGKRIALADAMRDFSLSGLKRLVSDAGANQAGLAGGFEVTTAPASATYPTSSVQRRWLDLSPEGYGGLDLAVEISGPCTTDELEAALHQVCQAHSGLRTRFIRSNEVWLQAPDGHVPITVVDISRLTAKARRIHLRDLVERNSVSPFDMETRVPFELTLLPLARDLHALVIHAHHVVFDGSSSTLFFRDVAKALEGGSLSPPGQYVDYAVSQNRYLNSAAIETARSYWSSVFRGAGLPTRIPAEREQEATDDRGEMVKFKVDPVTLERLRASARAWNATPFVFMMAAFGLLLSEATGEYDLVVGTTAAGRPSPITEGIIGVFVNPLPVRIQHNPSAPLSAYVAHVRDVLIGYHEHQNYPLEDLIRTVPSFQGYGLNDTFQSYLLYQNYSRPKAGRVNFASLDVGARLHHKLMREFEIVLENEDGGLSGELWFRTRRISRQGAMAYAARYVALLDTIWPLPES